MPGDEKAIIVTAVATFLVCTIAFIGFGLFKITQGQMNRRQVQEWGFVSLLLCLSTAVLYIGLINFF